MKKNDSGISDSFLAEKVYLGEILEKYVRQWKLFGISMIIAFSLALLYLQFATKKYLVTATILINDEDNDGGSTSEISTFEDLGLFRGPKTSLDTEIGILKSKNLIERVVDNLNLSVTYYTKKGLFYEEVYAEQRPFNIHLISKGRAEITLDTLFSIQATSKTKFDLFDSDDDYQGEASFGEKIKWVLGEFVTTPKAIDDIDLEERIFIRIRPVEDVSLELKKRIEVQQDNVNSNLLTLQVEDAVRQKGKDILDNLVVIYNKEAIEYKGEIAKSTNEFLSGRIDDISVALKSLDQGVQSYKTKNNLSDLDSETSLALASNAELTNRIVELTSQIKLIDYVTDYMSTNTEDLIPSNLGMLNENTSQNTISYNNLILERNRLAASAREGNPVISSLNAQITSLRESIDRSLSNTRSSLLISLDEATRQESNITSKISANPRKEREIRDIQRQQEIYETLYLYLLQKREENSISLAVTAPNAKVVDMAYGNRKPIAPRRMVVLMGSLIIGFLVPISVLTIKSLVNTKIRTLEDVEKLLRAPILGKIEHSNSKDLLVSFQTSTCISESFRLLRTNVQRLLSAKLDTKKPLVYEKKSSSIEKVERTTTDDPYFEPYFENMDEIPVARTIGITSTLENEGKSFVALNLAASIALLNKRVLLVEANLRRPILGHLLNLKMGKGLADILVNKRLKIADVINRLDSPNIDIMVAGSTRENPSELFSDNHFNEVLSKCKESYDYIIVDTPPVGPTTDTLLLGNLTDLFIYVIRANFLKRQKMAIPQKLFQENRLNNMAILLNDSGSKIPN